MRSIQHSWLEIKPRLSRALEWAMGDWGMPALFVLVALTSFGLGRLSALEDARPAVSIRAAPVAASPRAMALGGQFVASRTGTVYYYPWCAGAEQIAASKQVWFTSEKNAQAAGFRPAKNCKGLSDATQTVQ